MISTSGENGRVLILVVVTIFALSAFWFIALGETGSELRIVGGKKSDAQQFFDAEAGLNLAIEHFDALYNSLSGDVTTAVVSVTQTDPTDGNRVVANVTCRAIQNKDSALAQSYGLPVQKHEFRPPAGSGSGVNTTKAVRYGINSVAGNKEIQVGVYRVVPK